MAYSCSEIEGQVSVMEEEGEAFLQAGNLLPLWKGAYFQLCSKGVPKQEQNNICPWHETRKNGLCPYCAKSSKLYQMSLFPLS